MIASEAPPAQSLGDSDLMHAVREMSVALHLSGDDEARLEALKSELERRRRKRRGKEGA